MSFDLYFVRTPPDGDWSRVPDALEAAAEAASGADPKPTLTAADRSTWADLLLALEPVLPGADRFDDGAHVELSAANGIQLSWYPGELGLSIPYWYEGDEAERIVALLADVVGRVEVLTGLVAYDPQADGPFLPDGAAVAAASFTAVRASFAERLAGEAAIPVEPPTERPPRRGWFRRGGSRR